MAVEGDALLKFRKSLIEAINASKSTLENISRPVYLATCDAHNIAGWTKEQIMNYTPGWAQLKRNAMKGIHKDPEALMDIEDDFDLYELEESENTLEDEESVLEEYNRFVSSEHYVPKFKVFKKWIKKAINRDVYTNITDIDADYRVRYPEEAKKNLFDIKAWTEDYRNAFYEEVRKHNKFIFTSLGSFCNVDFNFLKSLKTYAKRNNAMIIGLPLFKGYDKSISNFCVDPTIRDYMWVAFEDVILNDNLMVQILRHSPTIKSTITGINQLVAKYNSSIIVAGINQQLRYIPVLKDRTPNLIASTGCCTEYEPVKKDEPVKILTKSEKLAQERLSIKGGLVVDLGAEDTFTVRNIEADADGSFIDLGIKYSIDSYSKVSSSTFVIGDLHAPNQNDELLEANIKAIKEYHCNRVVLHDSVNMAYVSHHNADKAIVRAQLAENGRANILTEIEVFANILDKLVSLPEVYEIVIPYSNHPEHLEQCIQDIGRMTKDDINLRTLLQCALAMLDGRNVLQYLTEDMVGYQNDKIDWVKKDEGREAFGVQVGLHGSEKVNGGRLTPTSTNNAFPKTVLAHRHSAGIDGDTITVGIACEKEQGYNHGLSSWTESSAIIYPNGKVQLLTFVNVRGEYKLWL